MLNDVSIFCVALVSSSPSPSSSLITPESSTTILPPLTPSPSPTSSSSRMTPSSTTRPTRGGQSSSSSYEVKPSETKTSPSKSDTFIPPFVTSSPGGKCSFYVTCAEYMHYLFLWLNGCSFLCLLSRTQLLLCNVIIDCRSRGSL